MATSSNKSVMALSPAEARTFALSLLGYPQAEIGRMESISERQVRYRIAKAKRVTGLQGMWTNAVLGVYGLIPKAVKVMERYLDGSGSRDGGDLSAAMRILEASGVMKSTKEPTIKVEQNTTVNTSSAESIYANMTTEEMYAEIEASARRTVASFEDKRERQKRLESRCRVVHKCREVNTPSP